MPPNDAQFHRSMIMGLLEAGDVVLGYALRILGVLRLLAGILCSGNPVRIEG
jgi:hypothetical protein